MGDLHPAQLHKLMRTWLLAEDPYGLNQRQEPTFEPVPSFPDTRASDYGQLAVAKAVDRAAAQAQPPPDPRAAPAGQAAVAKEFAPKVASEAFQGERNPRAQAWGEQAVGQSTAPSPTAEVDRTRAQAWGENAVDKALNPPTGSGMGMWGPGEAADTASAVGQSAVERALATKAKARKKLRDPVSETDKQSE